MNVIHTNSTATISFLPFRPYFLFGNMSVVFDVSGLFDGYAEISLNRRPSVVNTSVRNVRLFKKHGV